MKTGITIFGIYVIIYGFSAVAANARAEEYHAGRDIGEQQDYASANTKSSGENELQSVYIRVGSRRKNSFASENSTEYQDEMDERWILSNGHHHHSASKQPQHQNEDELIATSSEHPSYHQKKRVKVRRKKQRRRNQNRTMSPITTLTATATIIDNNPLENNVADSNIDSDADRATKLAQQKRRKNHRVNKSGQQQQQQQMIKKKKRNQLLQQQTRLSQLPIGGDDIDSISKNSASPVVVVENSETNSVNRDNFQNQDNESGIQMRRKTKIPRGKRREKMRLKEQERKLRMAAREEKRKLLQAKREMRERRKLERLQRKKMRNQKIGSMGDTAEKPAKRKNLKNVNKIGSHNINNTTGSSHRHFMAPPSIDYFVEKSSNYVDTNDTFLPFGGAIGVSLENPSTVIAAPADDEPAEVAISSRVMSEVLLNGAAGASAATNNMEESKIGGIEETDIDDDETMYEGGDLSCLKDGFRPAPEVPHADIKYLRNDLRGLENAFLEVEYICHHGFKMQFNRKGNQSNIFCKNGLWIGKRPSCVRIKNLTNFNETCNHPERCEQLCYISKGLEKCTCHKGFRMKKNRCEDINECTENTSVCEFGCINTVGSYRCKCPKGLRVGDANSCIDINECLLRNGHGPCQDTCINTWGSYKCSCDSLPGSQLSPDGHSCEDLDECSVNNGGCSHTCINTMGRAFCLCPEGWILDKDWKTCIDVDECSQQKFEDSDLRCEYGCINTPGSYTCLIDVGADQPIDDEQPECPDGYYRNIITEDCQDVNECTDDNGGCFDRCVNTVGSFHCSCRVGYIFGPDKYTCVVSNSSTDISCPPLFPPKHGYLECSRPIASDIIGVDTNGLGGRRRITNRPGSQCVLRCPTGFRINGKFSKQCSINGTWVGDGDGTCIRYPKPKLICPVDIVVETPPNETMAKLRIPRPKTDVNYDRDVTISPDWVRNSEVALEVGTKNITYAARHPVSKLSVSCSFTIKVLEGEPPVLKFCPGTKKYSLSKQHDSIKIVWNEPIFMDNVNVTEISRTNSPGNSFGVGSHQIIYIARDQAGYTARCVFKLLVNVPFRQTLNHPLPIYHMFYK